jgi:hypothetical protein
MLPAATRNRNDLYPRFAVYLGYGDEQGPTRSTLASTQRHIGFALGARVSGLGIPCLAALRRHNGYDCLDCVGSASAAVPRDVGSNDGGNDVADRRAHDPHFS